MIRHHKLGFLAAGLVAVLAACHPVKPAQSVRSGDAASECSDVSATPANTGRDARQAFGFAPTAAPRTPCTFENRAKPAAELPNADDPIWRLDMP